MENRIKNLRNQVEQYNRAYYSGEKTITNEAFDAMFQKLVELEKEYPEYFDPNSPTKRVGSERITNRSKAQHIKPAYSIKTATIEQIEQKLLKYGPMVAETKYDGVYISLVYSNGELKRATTRGNAIFGTLVTENIRTLKSVPLSIPDLNIHEIRGEVVIKKTKLTALNEKLEKEGKPTYPNCQAAAAAIIRMKKSSHVAKYPLIFVAHGISSPSLEKLRIEREKLKMCGFLVPKQQVCDSKSHISIAKDLIIHDAMPADGVVFKIQDPEKRDYLGNNKRYYNWAWAWKPKPEHTAKIIGVHWNITPKGNISPVACFEKPIVINGNKIIKAALNNYENVLSLGIGDGATAEIKFTGTVPNIVKAYGAKCSIQRPTHCPSCKHPVTVIGRHIRCDNKKHCIAQGGIPDKPVNYKYFHSQRNFQNWTSSHAAVIATKLGINVHRTKKGSPYIAIKFNALSQLAKFSYCMAGEVVPPELQKINGLNNSENPINKEEPDHSEINNESTTFTFNPAEYNTSVSEVINLFGEVYRIEQSGPNVTVHLMKHIMFYAIDYIFHTLGELKQEPIKVLNVTPVNTRKTSKINTTIRRRVMPWVRLAIAIAIISAFVWFVYSNM